MFPYRFKTLGLGKLIGKRTWGGVVGIRGPLPLVDGGQLNRPEFAPYDKDGKDWVIEGHGVDPGHRGGQRSGEGIPRRGPAARQGDRGDSGRAEDEALRHPADPAVPGSEQVGHGAKKGNVFHPRSRPRVPPSFPNSVWECLLLRNSVPMLTLERGVTSTRATELREGKPFPNGVWERGANERKTRGKRHAFPPANASPHPFYSRR